MDRTILASRLVEIANDIAKLAEGPSGKQDGTGPHGPQDGTEKQDCPHGRTPRRDVLPNA